MCVWLCQDSPQKVQDARSRPCLDCFPVPWKLEPKRGLPIRPLDVQEDESHRLFRRPPIGARDSGDGERYVGIESRARTACHRGRGLSRDRPILGQDLLRHTQETPLRVVRIGHRTADEHLAGARVSR